MILFKCIFNTLNKQEEKTIQAKQLTIQDLTLNFIEKRQHQFADTYKDIADKYDGFKNNLNIDNVFYSKGLYREMLIHANNELEKKWKSKILFENTPRGNVIMHYDPYKLGFAYYCDQNLSYDVLNAVAMKYVITFRCYDFFVDESFRNDTSPISKLTIEDNSENKNKGGLREKFKEQLKNAPFAKFKKYNKLSNKVSPDIEQLKNNIDDKTEEKESNRFINLGNVRNFSIIQKAPVKKSTIFNKSVYDDLFKGIDIQGGYDYKQFKKNILFTQSNN